MFHVEESVVLSCSDGIGTMNCSIKEASTQPPQAPIDEFVTAKRGSGVEDATSDDDLDKEILASRGKDSLCPSVRE